MEYHVPDGHDIGPIDISQEANQEGGSQSGPNQNMNLREVLNLIEDEDEEDDE